MAASLGQFPANFGFSGALVFTMAVGEYRSRASIAAQALITEQPFKATEIRCNANKLQTVDISQTDISQSGAKL